MGASSVFDKEDVVHIEDDNLKSIHSSVYLLNALAQRHQDARLLTSLLTFSAQPVCTTITLDAISLDTENIGKYFHYNNVGRLLTKKMTRLLDLIRDIIVFNKRRLFSVFKN